MLLFPVLSTVLQVFMQYTRYVAVLKWLALILFAYVITLFTVEVPWREALYRLVVPDVIFSKDYLTTMVAVFETTISPYLFFWPSQEAEDVRESPKRRLSTRAP